MRKWGSTRFSNPGAAQNCVCAHFSRQGDALSRSRGVQVYRRVEGERYMLRIAIRTAAAVLLFAALGGCNTIAGAGKDIERGGQVIRDTAKDVQKKM
jgi:predicted small secreted protein